MLRALHIATCVAALQKPLTIGKQSVVRSTATADVAQEVATVDLTDLLSTCVDACEHGCAEIRRVAAQLDRNNEGGVRQVDYKIAGDPRSALTAADLAALPSADHILVVGHRLVVRAEVAFDNLKAAVLENVGPKPPTGIKPCAHVDVAHVGCLLGRRPERLKSSFSTDLAARRRERFWTYTYTHKYIHT